jgi:hypothetical protein
MSEISIYETSNGSIEVRLERETVWLSQEQMGQRSDVNARSSPSMCAMSSPKVS